MNPLITPYPIDIIIKSPLHFNFFATSTSRSIEAPGLWQAADRAACDPGEAGADVRRLEELGIRIGGVLHVMGIPGIPQSLEACFSWKIHMEIRKNI